MVQISPERQSGSFTVLNLAASPICCNVVNLSLFDETQQEANGQPDERRDASIRSGIDQLSTGQFPDFGKDRRGDEVPACVGCPRSGGAKHSGEMAASKKVRHMSAARAASVDPGVVDHARMEATARLNPARKIEFGQFMTPGSVARFMASRWRLAISKADLNNSKPPGEIQAAKVARVSAASGSFEGFRVEGEVAAAKSSKLAAGASRPRAKI